MGGLAVNQNQPVLWRSETHRHLSGALPHRTLCGTSIAWVNVTTKPGLATCRRCIGMMMVKS